MIFRQPKYECTSNERDLIEVAITSFMPDDTRTIGQVELWKVVSRVRAERDPITAKH